VQVVGYETDVASGTAKPEGDGNPIAEAGGPIGGGLYVASGGTVDYVDASPGTELAFGLGERRCAGTVHEAPATPRTRHTATTTLTSGCAPGVPGRA